MTREEAIDNFKAQDFLLRGINTPEHKEALERNLLAIRSIEAWDAVLADIREIENRPNYMSHSSHYWQGFHEVEDIIKEHLQEVEE